MNQTALDRAVRKHREIVQWLSQWVQVVQGASWRSLADVRHNYPSADGVKLLSDVVVTVFNVKGNSYRLLTVIEYDAQRVYVVDMLTHAEYDKNQWKERL